MKTKNNSQNIENTGVSIDVVVSRGPVPSFRREARPELERRPFDQDLWARLESMEIDPPDATTRFQHRLKQYNKWTDEFAGRVDKEYRRFLYLAARTGHPVTPSDTVDQAWHLHLIYTRHYWEELCGKILGLQLHHDPSAGGTVENTRFERQYRRTLESYKAAFGETPPPDIWPPRGPARLGALGKTLLVAGGMIVVAAIAFKANNLAPFIFVGIAGIAGILAYRNVVTGALNPGKRGGGCGAAGSGGHAAAAGFCGSSGGDGGGGGCGSGGGCGGGGCGS